MLEKKIHLDLTWIEMLCLFSLPAFSNRIPYDLEHSQSSGLSLLPSEEPWYLYVSSAFLACSPSEFPRVCAILCPLLPVSTATFLQLSIDMAPMSCSTLYARRCLRACSSCSRAPMSWYRKRKRKKHKRKNQCARAGGGGGRAARCEQLEMGMCET